MEFDFSHFQVWVKMEKKKQSLEKKYIYLCFQTIALILFSENYFTFINWYTLIITIITVDLLLH